MIHLVTSDHWQIYNTFEIVPLIIGGMGTGLLISDRHSFPPSWATRSQRLWRIPSGLLLKELQGSSTRVQRKLKTEWLTNSQTYFTWWWTFTSLTTDFNTDPNLNGHLHYPNDIDTSLNEDVTEKNWKYRSDYENNPPNVNFFMSAVGSTSGRLHREFVLLLFLQTHWETDRFFAVSGVVGTGTPKDEDEVNRREVCECDGWVCVCETMGEPSIFRVIRKVVVLSRMLSHFDLNWEENTTRW